METPDKNSRLSGRHAVVTGGGRGIGAAIACELASFGADLTLMGRDLGRLEAMMEKLRGDFDQKFHVVSVDVTVPDRVVSAFADARKALGDPHVLVNNVGQVETAPFSKMDLELWRRMIDVNLTSMYLACREVLPAMLGANFGRIVNIASTAGVAGYPYVSAYSAAKHGVIGLTRSLACETAAQGVTVNAVCPGYTDTDLVEDAVVKVAKTTGRSQEEIRNSYRAANPQGRFIEPEEVAHTVGWLCLPGQGAVTGQAIVIDGGETL